MANRQGILRMHQGDDAVTFQAEGRATMQQSLPLRRAAERALGCGCRALRIDLRRCTYMDSTFMGTLLFLLRAVRKRGQAEFTLLSPSPECQTLIHDMGLDDVYPVVTADELPAGPWSEWDGESGEPDAFKCNVVQAHQELADLPGPAGEPFRRVMRCLATDPSPDADKVKQRD